MATTKESTSRAGRWLILVTAFLGWMMAGVQLGVSSIVMREAAKDLLGMAMVGEVPEGLVGQWFGWLTGAFLLGGAAGGYFFGWLGDTFGRKQAMALCIGCYSLFAGLTYFVVAPWQLLVMRFLIGLGVGGMWPNGIALVSEAWPNISRPMLAGAIGTAANVGIMLFSILTCFQTVTTEEWRWVMTMSATPVLLAAFVPLFVPESPRWLALRRKRLTGTEADEPSAISPLVEVFRPPILRVTLLGILLGTIPLFGGWGSSNWANTWASQAGEQLDIQDPTLKAKTLLARSAPGSLASLLGGALAILIGRRLCYFLLSVSCLFCSQYMFWFSHPTEPNFLWWTGALGLFSGFFFGWLPLCLPELFPTRVRSTGAGVSFNFGRIATAIGLLVAAGLLKDLYDADYAAIGRLTSWIYAIGAIAICFAPDTAKKGLED